MNKIPSTKVKLPIKNIKLPSLNSLNEPDEIKPNFFKTLTDLNHSVFKYGLQSNNNDSNFEDPTYLGFTIELDMNSPLFKDLPIFLQNKANEGIPGMKGRLDVHTEFVEKVQKIFNGQDSAKDDRDKTNYVKQHYINSITGLEILNKKFIDWKEDKLTFELYEDIALYTTYLSHLYNNLVYSYENGRVMVPDNLCKFNMYIKISEIRNLTSIKGLLPKSAFNNDSEDKRNEAIAKALKYNISAITYKLHDCEFDFFASKPFDDTITQSGIDANTPTVSILNMDLYFKSVSRTIYNPLIDGALSLNDLNPNLNSDLNIDGTIKNEAFSHVTKRPSNYETYDNEINKFNSELDNNDIYTFNTFINNDIIKQNEDNAPVDVIDTFDPVKGGKLNQFDPQNMINEFGKSIKNKALGGVQKLKDNARNRLQAEIDKKRKEIINSITDSVSKKLGLKRLSIAGQNVYTDNLAQVKLSNIVGSNIAKDIKNLLS